MLLPISEAPIVPNLIKIVIEQPEPEIEQKQITWKDNPNQCNDRTHWIASEKPFYCIAKPSPISRENTVKQAQNPSYVVIDSTAAPVGYFKWGWCTYGAWSLTGWAGAWGNANMWDDNARKSGHTVSNTPIVGSIFVDNGGRYGHVGLVTAVNGSNITVKDMNYSGFGQWTTRTVSASNYVYIYP